MNNSFENMTLEHKNEIMDIFNYYISNSFSAFPENELSMDFYDRLIEMTKDYPAFAIKLDSKVVGFCFLRAYNQFSTFKNCAEISYFISKDYVGKGIGNAALSKLESEARFKGIKTILASISSENQKSIQFHLRNCFVECGRFKNIGQKLNKQFDIVWMQKILD